MKTVKPKSSKSTSPRLLTSRPASKADIVISIKKKFMDLIVARTKNHEFRKYLIPLTVKRMWFYVSAPDQTLRYIAVVSRGKKPGEIEFENGVGNADFNARRLNGVSKYAYEILELYQLREPISLSTMQEVFATTFPQRYTYATDALLNAVNLDEQIRLF